MSVRKAKKFYAFDVGGERGIVTSWPECEAKVRGRQARYRGFATRAEAEAWLSTGALYEHKERQAAGERWALPAQAVFFDSGTGRGEGVEVNVTDREGLPVLHLVLPAESLTPRGTAFMPEGATNNYGELMGCLYAIRVARALGVKLVCGDSALVLDYWSKGHVSREKRAEDPELARAAEAVAAERRAFESEGGRLQHVRGRVNPADLGFHRE
jgi:ribonuclease HI